ncbi:16S rRNA (guanine(966)-N(2))-methyltransferase RsmD [Falsarthrobacter nasiphocae]|uniref:16S rRNA (Guanine966-N2)-methyltransferase n=1 Tax=Falsarthrobacter nasiphocae TaxID=189863 RepID=A0AAE3YG73_9MICC|nr:16S rRNA (guanine966-N2)-methyltransferase [Falsarthrobacter nasiphocae]
MSRIIAGAAGGLRLTSVPGAGTRPTTDRVKEAIFSRLESYGVLAGAEVLDLYAGSGALGLEALSRGAASVELVESHAGAARVCQQNARAVTSKLPGARAKVSRAKVESHVRSLAPGLDLVLVDPPYDVPNEQLTAVLEPVAAALAPGGTVVVERGKRTGEPQWPAGLTCEAVKTYGETTVFYLEATEAIETPGAEPSEHPSGESDPAER